MDAELFRHRKPASATAQLEGLGLFETAVNVPDIRTEAPSAPGSETSRLAAQAIDGPLRKKSYRRIMLALGAASRPLSRQEICERTNLLESTACARLAELRPQWIRAVDGVCTSQSGKRCDGYELTDLGRARLAQAGAA